MGVDERSQSLSELVYRHRAIWAPAVWFGAVVSIEFALNAAVYFPIPRPILQWLLWTGPNVVAAAMSAFIVLASLWTGLGVGSWPWRIVSALTAIGLLAVIQSSGLLPLLIVFYSLLWSVWAAIGWWVRWRWRRVWGLIDRSANSNAGHTTIKDLLILTALLACALGLGGWLLRREPIEQDIYDSMKGWSFVLSVGFNFVCMLVAAVSLFPVLIAMLPIHPQPLSWRRAIIGGVVSTPLIVLVNGLMAYPHYSQVFGQINLGWTILMWLVSAAFQVLAIVASIVWLRWAGYRLVELPSARSSEMTMTSTPIHP
ncbi:hypothetical protein [Botrimarina mediterranea]|uniref:Uncharacterized protein n=1 Tax=Botrimarina mediterranea TaxID=2528022 RepID=A0A518KE14_9BACT|nr:hypothetical protein [Botrimarina mediterranea]QDV76031.1 hypothetical protein Spa11_42550 [Botrimarina mediterranea]QDV80626.1 hypothetical protein K2D_42560 [Planctomycetes bacterium K2D]